VSNLTRAALRGDITRASGAALGGRGDIFGTNNDMTGVGASTVNDSISLSASDDGGTLWMSGGSNVRLGSGDVLGKIPVGGGIHLGTSALDSSRGSPRRRRRWYPARRPGSSKREWRSKQRRLPSHRPEYTRRQHHPWQRWRHSRWHPEQRSATAGAHRSSSSLAWVTPQRTCTTPHQPPRRKTWQ
jgi:hypothetical protein